MVFDIDIQKRYRKYYKHLCLGGFCCSCSVAANHEALSRLRHGFKSRREHSFLLHNYQLVTVFCSVSSVVLSSDVNPVAEGIVSEASLSHIHGGRFVIWRCQHASVCVDACLPQYRSCNIQESVYTITPLGGNTRTMWVQTTRCGNHPGRR